MKRFKLSIYIAFHRKSPFLELDYTASAKCRIGISHHSMDNQASKKEHLMKSGIADLKKMEKELEAKDEENKVL
jgi:hypothetical protein